MVISLALKCLEIVFRMMNYILPEYSLPTEFTTGVNLLFSDMAKLNEMFPVITLFKALLWIFLFHLIYYLTKLIGSLISILRGGGEIKI